MAMGQWWDEGVQGELFLTSADFPPSPGHAFYDKLNSLLREAGFDPFVERTCRSFYDNGAKGGRPSVAPGVYFRMLFVGYFEGVDSQRGIAWRCADSFSLRSFLGLSWKEPVPDHSSLSKIRKRLPESVHEAVFAWVLKLCADKHLLTDPSVVGVDSTTIEANAAMRSIVRKETKQTYHEYVKTLMREDEMSKETPTITPRKCRPQLAQASSSCSSRSLGLATVMRLRVRAAQAGQGRLCARFSAAASRATSLCLTAPPRLGGARAARGAPPSHLTRAAYCRGRGRAGRLAA